MVDEATKDFSPNLEDGFSFADEANDNKADIVKEDMSATADGIETTYVLANVPLSASLQVYLNGLLQQIGTSKDYRLNPVSGQTQSVVFYTAPATGDIVLIHYIIDNA